jgi:hypothetical protein
VAIIPIDIPEAIAVADLALTKPLEAVGIKAVVIPATAGAADMTPYVEQALKAKPQMMVMLQDEDDDIRVAQAAEQLGYTGEFSPAGYGTSYLRELSPAAVKKSVVVTSLDFASVNPQQQFFVSALNKYQHGTTVNEYSADEFSEVMTLQTNLQEPRRRQLHRRRRPQHRQGTPQHPGIHGQGTRRLHPGHVRRRAHPRVQPLAPHRHAKRQRDLHRHRRQLDPRMSPARNHRGRR